MHDFFEGVQLHGLADVIVHAGVQTFFARAIHCVACHGNDVGVSFGAVGMPGFAPADFGGSLVSVQLRQLAIHENDIIGDQFHGLQDLAAIGDGDGAIAEFFQEADGDLLVDGVVFGHQDVQQGESVAHRCPGGGSSGLLALLPKARLTRNRRGQHAGQAIDELGVLDGFDQEGADTSGTKQGGVTAGPEGGHQEKARFGEERVRLDRAGQAQSIHFRHLHIQDRQCNGIGGSGL